MTKYLLLNIFLLAILLSGCSIRWKLSDGVYVNGIKIKSCKKIGKLVVCDSDVRV